MNRVRRFLNLQRKSRLRRQARYYRQAFELVYAAAQCLKDARQLEYWNYPEGAQKIFLRDVDALLREAQRFAHKGQLRNLR